MKKILGLALSLMIVFTAFAGMASAATPNNDIKVKLNGEWVIFPAPPVLISGKTFVEFRTLFTELGYTIDYNAATKTIKAKSDARSIQMTPTGTSALVDGVKIPVNGEMKLLNGRTMVGVRFIATLSDKDVAWDGAKKIVTITDKRPTAAQQAELFGILDGLAAAEDKQDAAAYLSFIHSQSPMKPFLEESLPAQYAAMHIRTKYVKRSIESFNSSEIVVYTVEDSTKVGGTGFFPDMEYEMYYTFHKEANGKWAIYDLYQDSQFLLNEDGLWAQEVTAPDADKAALTGLVKAQVDAINANDMDAYKATLLAGADGFDEDVDSLKEMLSDDEFALKVQLNRTAIVELNEDSAIVAVEFRYDVGNGDDALAFKSLTLYRMEKKDGKWFVLPGSNENEISGEDIT